MYVMVAADLVPRRTKANLTGGTLDHLVLSRVKKLKTYHTDLLFLKNC